MQNRQICKQSRSLGLSGREWRHFAISVPVLRNKSVDVSEAVAPQNINHRTGYPVGTEHFGSDSPEALVTVGAHTQRLRTVISQNLRRYADGVTNRLRRQHRLELHRYAGFLMPGIYEIVAIAKSATVDQRRIIHATGTTLGIFASSQAAAALEHALLRPLVMSLEGGARKENIPQGRRSITVKRFEEAVEANFDNPLLIPDLCRIIGVSGRTLRMLCQEQLGVSPQQFLALRRLHLAQRALLHADQHSATVTEIATSLGVWELGRFAATYKSRFGESPSATLHRPSGILTPPVSDPRKILARSA
jgi:AraC-like DNA-binding protein